VRAGLLELQAGVGCECMQGETEGDPKRQAMTQPQPDEPACVSAVELVALLWLLRLPLLPCPLAPAPAAPAPAPAEAAKVGAPPLTAAGPLAPVCCSDPSVGCGPAPTSDRRRDEARVWRGGRRGESSALALPSLPSVQGMRGLSVGGFARKTVKVRDAPSAVSIGNVRTLRWTMVLLPPGRTPSPSALNVLSSSSIRPL
jgi:hypothetical protein